MSDTPETDKRVEDNKHIKCIQEDHWVGTNKVTFENPIVDLCRQFERERDKLHDIIRRAKTAFAEDGSDGEICARMFKILTEAKE
jgi:hypothetical protein